jgi:glucose-1-phosphate cytidylyltransferase
MKVVILAGGLGTRISEESILKPKPMIEIGGKAILWHIMKSYSAHGFREFVICAGYKGYMIKEYFANYFLHNSNVTFDLKNNQMKVHHNSSEDWSVTIADTGESSMTGGRLLRVAEFLGSEDFCMTYGDGLSDVNIAKTVEFHTAHKKLATVTAVQPPGRFGTLDLQDHTVKRFLEKPKGDGGFINGGFFVLNPKVLSYIKDESTSWEKEPLEKLAAEGQLQAYQHEGFWQPMDTLRDKNHLEELWSSKNPPWKNWRDA